MIPVCHSGLALTDLPVPFNLLQAVLFSSAEGWQKLYDALAAVADVKAPAVNFQTLAQDMRKIEEQCRLSTSSIERIANPRILCAASPQYADPSMGFHLDVAVLEQVFGKAQVVVEPALTRKRLSELLSTQRFDIVHLVTGVDPKTGDVIFSDLDARGQPAKSKLDKLSALGLSSLLAESKTRLLVLATCRALKLAVVLARLLNMVGTEEELSGEQAAEWAETFYGLLRQGQPVHKAFDLATAQVETPLLLVPHRDVAFAWPPP